MEVIESNSVIDKNKDNYGLIKGLKVNSLIILLSGFVILIGSMLVFLLIVKNVYGKFELSEILPTKENILYHPEEEKVALLYSIYTENMTDDGNTWVQDNLDTWMNFLKKFNVPYEVLTDLDIENGTHFNYKILILAGAKSLSDNEISQLKRYADSGGSIFATGGVGTYSDEGKWKGWQFFSETFGMNFTREISQEDEIYKVHTLRGNLPITAGIPTGYALNIATWDRPIYSEIIEPRVEQVSYWFDYRREKGLVAEEIKKSAGIAYGNYGEGRFIWFGFEINSVIGTQKDHIYFGRLFQNCMSWLNYKPTSFIKDWPAPFDAAALFIVTFENDFENVELLKDLLNNYNYPTTIFVDSDLALSKPKQIRTLSKYASINPIINFSQNKINHEEINELVELNSQVVKLNTITDSLFKLSGRKVEGIMVLNGEYEQSRLNAIAQTDLTYLLMDSLTDRSVPKKIIIDDNPIHIITNTARDDKQVIGEYGLKNLEFQKYTYKEDIDRILLEGGLYVMKFHNQYQFKPEYISVIKDLAIYLRSKNIWFTSISNIVNWWQKKSSIELRYETRSKRRIAVEVSNHNYYTTDEFIVQIFLNKEVSNIEVTTDMINTPIPNFEFDSNQNVLYMHVDKLKSDETRTFLVDFVNVEV